MSENFVSLYRENPVHVWEPDDDLRTDLCPFLQIKLPGLPFCAKWKCGHVAVQARWGILWARESHFYRMYASKLLAAELRERSKASSAWPDGFRSRNLFDV